ncbi:hypothetical protein WJX84_000948 [Apatococcus fuscideae]|uniref:Mechanosensitive ion channel MscS domain-containing protein n=1 Tax=Apatococcus fuscideae TaxID=2026836 RepID=A0AAW1SXN8_9CHLO
MVVSKWLAMLTETSLRSLIVMDKLILQMSEIAIIGFGVWTLLRLKERFVTIAVDLDQREQGPPAPGQEKTLERVVLPLSGLTSWMMVLVGGLMAMHVLGINIQPLLTVGGVSGIIVGLSAQSVLGNLISGINLFLSRPFVVGDRVELLTSGGSKFMVGYVERVDPMRTIFRTDACLPVMIPNKVIGDMVISNESRIARSRVVTHFNKARQYSMSIALRYQDWEKAEAIASDMKKYLDKHDGVDKRLPCFVGISGFENFALNVAVIMHTTPSMSRDFGNFRQKVLLRLYQIVKAHDAQLAYPTQVEIRPTGDVESHWNPAQGKNGPVVTTGAQNAAQQMSSSMQPN